ncbi:hypothetical protein [Peribacillus frigoritolerans]|uniref:hypothetical protein n=1 Tax=Peribacillus castrilensis TaxID=2897690 RepID=UPI00296FDCB9|nr:hypothetical protein [Peribacillus castrilensis]
MCVFTMASSDLESPYDKENASIFLEESIMIAVFHFLELFGKFSPICYNTMVNQLVDGGLHE